MRNPDRIPHIIERLQVLWETVPDWRLGQLVCNLARLIGRMDPFHVEDDKMLNAIESYIYFFEQKSQDKEEPEVVAND